MLVIVPVVTPVPELYEATLIVAVVPAFWVLVPLLPSGPLHLWAALPKAEAVTLPMAVLVPMDSSVTVPEEVPTEHVKLALCVTSVRVKVVPAEAAEVKLVPPV